MLAESTQHSVVERNMPACLLLCWPWWWRSGRLAVVGRSSVKAGGCDQIAGRVRTEWVDYIARGGKDSRKKKKGRKRKKTTATRCSLGGVDAAESGCGVDE